MTLTGRTEIWRATLDVWRENPLFGYGPRLWDVDMSFRFLPTLGWAPAQAHNQVVQTLGEAGLIGLAGLAVYVVVLLRWGVRLRSRSNGSSLLLVMVLLFRSLADRWYSAGATDGNLFVHFVVFAALLLWVRSRAPLPTSLNRHPRGERRASRVPVGRT
ncbi:MAG: hypothetical protein KatS3mg014_1748 [Actinomycetota bacterium]|nr:MAG: hypothetical protein KatS3mg014_1748 [Actinomycetota bacterium]